MHQWRDIICFTIDTFKLKRSFESKHKKCTSKNIHFARKYQVFTFLELQYNIFQTNQRV